MADIYRLEKKIYRFLVQVAPTTGIVCASDMSMGIKINIKLLWKGLS